MFPRDADVRYDPTFPVSVFSRARILPVVEIGVMQLRSNALHVAFIHS